METRLLPATILITVLALPASLIRQPLKTPGIAPS